MSVTHERNLTLEWVKLISACLVVCIHYPPPGVLGTSLVCTARFAVPLFFAISGYYAANAAPASVARKIKRSFWNVIWGNGLYFFTQLFFKLVSHNDSILEWLHSVFNCPKFSLFLLTGVPPFLGFQLWFLSALLFCYVVLYFYVKLFEGEQVRYQYLYCIAVCLMAIFFFADSLINLRYLVGGNEAYRNGLFMGLPSFSFGIFLKEHQERIVRVFGWNNMRCFLLIAAGLFLGLLQCFGSQHQVELPPGLMLVAVELLLFCTQNPDLPKRIPLLAKLSSWAGKMSAWIFLLHVLVYHVIEKLLEKLVFLREIADSLAVPSILWVLLLTAALSHMMCVFTDCINQLRKNRITGRNEPD